MKFLSLNKNQSAVLTTLAGVLFLGACYFFIYIPANEKSLQEQRFRSLQNIDRNIHSKIDNSAALLNNILTAYHAYRANPASRVALANYISRYSKNNFTLSQPQILADSASKNIGDSTYTILADNATKQINLVLKKKIDQSAYQIAMKLSFEQFIQYLLPKDVFNEYIVFSDQKVIYESFPSGLSYVKKDSLLGERNGFSGGSMRSLKISGTDYKLFMQPVTFSSQHEWVITGLLSNSVYQQEKNQLPPRIVLFLITLVLSIMVAFPWIKLYQMGNKDRLTITDGASSVVVSMLLISLLFFAFFKYNAYLRPDKIPDSSSALSARIKNAFKQELTLAYQSLTVYDQLLKSRKVKGTSVRKLGKDSVEIGNQYTNSSAKASDSVKLLLNTPAKDLRVNQVFWLNAKGAELINWTSASDNAPLGDFRNRDYFKKIVGGNTYRLNNDPQKTFYIDQVISWTSGTFTSVLSVPSLLSTERSNVVAAMSFNINSLEKVLLAPGYQFALINNSGKVLYHSDVSRNLNENLLNEFSESNKLQSLIQAKAGGAFTTKYFSTNYKVLIEPVNNLPYFVVIFNDLSYKDTHDMEVYSFTISMLFCFFAFLIFQLTLIFMASSKRSFFKKQLFDTSWIGPKISSHREYTISALVNGIIILLLVFFFKSSSFLQYLFMLVFSATFIVAFLNMLYAKRYRKENKDSFYQFKYTAIRWLCVWSFILALLALRILDIPHFINLLVFQILAIAVGVIFYFYSDRILVRLRNVQTNYLPALKWTHIRSFTLMCLTRLILTSGIPVTFFYIASYNYEQNLDIRYRQVGFASQLVEKLPALKILPADIKTGLNYRAGIYRDGAFIRDITYQRSADSLPGYTREEEVTIKLLGLFRIFITDKAVLQDKLYLSQTADSVILHNHLLREASQTNSGTVTYVQTRVPGYLKLSSACLNYNLPTIFSTSFTDILNGLLYWALLLIALVVFYLIIYNVIKKLFSLNLPDIKTWENLDNKILVNNDLNDLLFVIGLPGSGKVHHVLEKIKTREIKLDDGTPLICDKKNPEKGNVFVADLINIPDAGDDREKNAEWTKFKSRVFNEENRIIIVNHFEYNIQDAVTNRIKLNFLESLMLENKCKIIILSTVHPVAFLDSILEQAVPADAKIIPAQDLERWHVLLGHYRIVVLPLQVNKEPQKDDSWKEIINETAYTHFLDKIRDSAIEVGGKMSTEERATKGDELAFKLQVSSHYFYMYIWKSLIKEEKFLLYDLAEDGLVNSFDDYNLSMLIEKGVIIRTEDGSLRLFNKGFRNFILTAIGNTEAMKIKNQIKDNGNWGKMKTPLLVVIFAILAFLFASQQEAYSKVITYITAFAAGVPTILKLLTIFDKSPEKNGT